MRSLEAAEIADLGSGLGPSLLLTFRGFRMLQVDTTDVSEGRCRATRLRTPSHACHLADEIWVRAQLGATTCTIGCKHCINVSAHHPQSCTHPALVVPTHVIRFRCPPSGLTPDTISVTSTFIPLQRATLLSGKRHESTIHLSALHHSTHVGAIGFGLYIASVAWQTRHHA